MIKMSQRRRNGSLFRYKSLISSQYTYICDWAMIAALFIIGIAMDTYIPPVNREALRGDTSILYSHSRSERVSSMWIFIIGPLPALIIIITLLIMRRSINQVHVTLLAFFFAHACSLVACTTLKIHVGRLRPDFISRCKPLPVSIDSYIFGACTGNESLVTEGRKSFPSGHASQISTALYFLSFFLLGNLPNPKFRGGKIAKMLVIMLPLYISGFISITRVADNRHHWDDVIAGIMLAIVISFICYRTYYPCPFSSPESYIPKIRLSDREYKDLMRDKSLYSTGYTLSSDPDILEENPGISKNIKSCEIRDLESPNTIHDDDDARINMSQ